MNINQLKKKLDKAIYAREKGQLTESRILFECLVKLIKEKINGKPSKAVNFIYITIMAENIIQLRLEGQQKLRQALKLGQELLNYDKKYKINNPLSIRSVSNILADLGKYEMAKPFFKQMIQMYQNNSLRMGEAQAHLAYSFLRTGRAKEANNLITLALKNIKANTAEEKYQEVRESYALIVQSLIYKTMGKIKDGKKIAKQALVIAQAGHATHRIRQAKENLSSFELKKTKLF